jgi:hypothetical protein
MSTLPKPATELSAPRSLTPPRNGLKVTSSNQKMSRFNSSSSNTSVRGASSSFNVNSSNSMIGLKSKFNKKDSVSSAVSDDDEKDDNLPLPVSPENLVYIRDNQLAWIPAIRMTSSNDGTTATKESERVKVKNYTADDEQSITLHNFMKEIKKREYTSNTVDWKEIEVKLDQYAGKMLPIQSLFPKGTTSYADMAEFDHLHEVSYYSCRILTSSLFDATDL